MENIKSRILAGAFAALVTAGLVITAEDKQTVASPPQNQHVVIPLTERDELPPKKVISHKAEAAMQVKADVPVKVEQPKPKPVVNKKPVKKITKPQAQASVNGGVWEAISKCESSGNWSARNSSGKYTGGLQFDVPTWLSNGGGKYAPYAGAATKAQQIEIANVVRSRRGLQPWACARILGLK